jgi:putative transposase
MTTKHDPYENAVAERVNGTLKNEFDLGDRLPDQKNADRESTKLSGFTTTSDLMKAVNYLTPFQAHTNENIELKKWP